MRALHAKEEVSNHEQCENQDNTHLGLTWRGLRPTLTYNRLFDKRIVREAHYRTNTVRYSMLTGTFPVLLALHPSHFRNALPQRMTTTTGAAHEEDPRT